MHARTESIHELVALQRRLILEMLRRAEPLELDRIPPVWPLGPEDVGRAVDALQAEGAVALGWDRTVPGRRTVRLTADGLALLRSWRDAAGPLGPGTAGRAAD